MLSLHISHGRLSSTRACLDTRNCKHKIFVCRAEFNNRVDLCTLHSVLATMFVVWLLRDLLLMPTVVQGRGLSSHFRLPEQCSCDVSYTSPRP